MYEQLTKDRTEA